MRIDKYLKESRLIKRRTIAKQMCDANKIQVNNHYVKAGYEIKLADIIKIEYARYIYSVEVKKLMFQPGKESAADSYIELEKIEKLQSGSVQ